MYAHIHTANIDHLKAECIKVEAVGYNGLPGIKITGLPDPVVKESFHRVSSAFRASKIDLPLKRFIINFVPADIPKKGSGLDLAIATVLLKAIGVIPTETLNDTLVFGELSLTGEVRSVKGVLPVLNFAQKKFSKVVIPYENINEACFFKDKAIAIKHLKDVIKIAEQTFEPYKDIAPQLQINDFKPQVDFGDIIGQPIALRCAQISVTGKHHMLLIGSPGCGKTMIGERIPGIMPPLNSQEKLEINSIYSISGLLNSETPLIEQRPYRSPHHSSTDSALIGGSRVGEITLAHKGVLFLDELSEFKHNVLNALREPLEKGSINISRANYFQTMPADFLLIAASNPCNCGNLLKRDGTCNCTDHSLDRFKRRLNGPLMDRFDIKLTMCAPKISVDQLSSTKDASINSSKIKEAVINALEFKKELKEKGIKLKLCSKAKTILDKHIDQNSLSIRAFKKAINISKTIAHLEHKDVIQEEHVLESLCYTKPIFYENKNPR